MTLNEYQQAVMRTEGGLAPSELLMNAALGICGEGGEVADLVKKAAFQGHYLNKEHVAKELGDCFWYLAVGAKAIGYTLDEIGQMNLAKLEARYPNGFEVERSLHRAEGDV